tara:strand:- start:209 stop:433 length:225 start_codon:yes stop_codon:yes gene_type:complete
MERFKPGRTNKEDRMNFVSYWASFVRTHSDKEWGEQQKRFINSLMHSAKHYPLTPKQYLKIKKEKIEESRILNK